MASIISLQAMAWQDSAKTWAAASSALSFLALASVWPDFFRVFLGLPFWWVFDVAMTCLLFSGVCEQGAARTSRCHREGSVLGFALKSRQFRLGFHRFWQVLWRPKKLRNPLELALRWALLRGSVNSVGWRFRVLPEGRNVCT